MDLDDWITRIRSRNAVVFEDAYHGERPTGLDVVPRLLAEMQAAEDSYTRGKFAELLGEMGDESIVPYLVAELSHPHADARRWAALALEQLGSPEGIAAARLHRENRPGDY